VREESPGQCPICGMDLVPIQKDEGSANDMHEHGTMNMEVGVAADNTHDMHGMHDTGGMEMGGMAPMNPSQHRQMMVGMAMSTAQLPWALGIGAASALFLVILLARTPWPLAPAGPTGDATSAVGELLLSRYMIAFEGAAFLILAGIAGAVILARREPAPSTQVNMPVSPTLPVPFSEAQIGEGQMPERGERVESEGTIYTCPMHPQVREESPGQCPICGMDLVPVEVGATTAMPAGRGGHAIGSGHNKHGEKL
ncbi:MAG: NADH-quinone oxidoreductase subunit J, partial [Chloroflexi bacterium]|nr:NADH-quinone oxidoreductase subunit J [Chloroflexota bacterium]